MNHRDDAMRFLKSSKMNLFLRSIYRNNFINWIGFICLYLVVIMGIVAFIYYATRLPLGAFVQ